MNRKLPISPNRQQAEKPAMVNPVNCMPVGQKLEDNPNSWRKIMNKKQYKVRTYKVSYFNRSELVLEKTYTCIKPKFWEYCKCQLAFLKADHPDWSVRFEYTEVVKPVNLTSLFLTKEKRHEIALLMKKIKDMYAPYVKNSLLAIRLRTLSIDMWNQLQNEFYMTANITDNTIWHWQDELEKFEEYGYMFYGKEPEALTDWTKLLSGWYNREWAVEVLRLITDFNLDNQPRDYVTVFQNDFRRVTNEEQFCSVLLKWHDLIHYSPWKLALYDNTFQKPDNAHYEDEFNDEFGDEENFDFYSYSEEV